MMDLFSQPPGQPVPVPDEGQSQILSHGNDKLRGGGGGRCPEIGGEVGDGEVDLVAHRRYDGNPGSPNGPGDPLVVERKQVFQGAPAPGQDDHVREPVFVQKGNGVADLRGSLVTLDADGRDEDVHGREAPPGDVQDIPDGGAARGGDHADPSGKEGDRLLEGGVEEPFRLEAFFQGFEGPLEGAEAAGFGGVHDDLVLPPGAVDGDPSPAEDLHAVLEVKTQPGRALAEENGPDLGFFILQGEINVSRRRAAKIGHLPGDPQEAEGLLEEGPDLFREFRYRQDQSCLIIVQHAGFPPFLAIRTV